MMRNDSRYHFLLYTGRFYSRCKNWSFKMSAVQYIYDDTASLIVAATICLDKF